MKPFLYLFFMISILGCTNTKKPAANASDTSAVVKPKPVAVTPSFDQDSLRLTDAALLVKSIYDTVANPPQTDMKEDTVTRNDAHLSHYEDPSGQYYVYVVENRGPMFGVSVGWCDVFLFKRLDGVWTLNDLRLKAGGGGMYGNPGTFEKLEQIGEESKAIVISGGQSHMGNNFNVTMIELNKGKLGRTFGFPTRHDYGEGSGDGYKLTICDENTYYFIKALGNKNYDLILERFNCLDESPIKVDSAVVPYQNGYKIPKRFLFGE